MKTPTELGHTEWRVALLVLIAVVSVFSAESAQGIPEYAKDLPQELKNFCNVCHVRNSGGPLNGFGEDYHRYNENLDVLMAIDSDDDGFTNGDELAEAKNPGNPKSYPDDRKGFGTIVITGFLGVVLAVSAILLAQRRQ